MAHARHPRTPQRASLLSPRNRRQLLEAHRSALLSNPAASLGWSKLLVAGALLAGCLLLVPKQRGLQDHPVQQLAWGMLVVFGVGAVLAFKSYLEDHRAPAGAAPASFLSPRQRELLNLPHASQRADGGAGAGAFTGPGGGAISTPRAATRHQRDASPQRRSLASPVGSVPALLRAGHGALKHSGSPLWGEAAVQAALDHVRNPALAVQGHADAAAGPEQPYAFDTMELIPPFSPPAHQHAHQHPPHSQNFPLVHPHQISHHTLLAADARERDAEARLQHHELLQRLGLEGKMDGANGAKARASKLLFDEMKAFLDERYMQTLNAALKSFGVEVDTGAENLKRGGAVRLKFFPPPKGGNVSQGQKEAKQSWTNIVRVLLFLDGSLEHHVGDGGAGVGVKPAQAQAPGLAFGIANKPQPALSAAPLRPGNHWFESVVDDLEAHCMSRAVPAQPAALGAPAIGGFFNAPAAPPPAAPAKVQADADDAKHWKALRILAQAFEQSIHAPLNQRVYSRERLWGLSHETVTKLRWGQKEDPTQPSDDEIVMRFFSWFMDDGIEQQQEAQNLPRSDLPGLRHFSRHHFRDTPPDANGHVRERRTMIFRCPRTNSFKVWVGAARALQHRKQNAPVEQNALTAIVLFLFQCHSSLRRTTVPENNLVFEFVRQKQIGKKVFSM